MAATKGKSGTGAGAARPKIASSHAARPKPAEGALKRTAKKAALPAAKERPAVLKKKPPPPKVGRRAARGIASRDGRSPAPEAHAPRSQRTIASDEAAQLALVIAAAGLEKKAVNVQIVEVVGRVDYTDYIVVMSGRSDRHVLSVADEIEGALLRMTPKRKPIAVEGRPIGNWVVLDCGDVVAHVFQEEARSFYDLDSLWQDARRVPVPLEVPRESPRDSGRV